MSSFEIYLLWIVIPHLDCFFAITFGILIILGFILSWYLLAKQYDLDSAFEKKCWKYVKWFFIYGLISLFLSVFTSDRKNIAIVYLAPKIINNQTIQQIPAEIMKFIDKEIEDKDSK